MRIFVGIEYDIKNNFINSFTYLNKSYVVYYFKKEIYIFDSKCPHAQGDLRMATFDNGYIICPSHGLRFSLRNGEVDINETKDDFRESIIAKGLEKMKVHFLNIINEDGNIYVDID